MIEISLNNEKQTIDNLSVEQLLKQFAFCQDKVAVAINSEFIPRSSYAQHSLNHGDKVDVLSAVQGG